MGAPILVGWATGDITAGLMATIGAFTSVYGSDRPYLNRALFLAVIAVSFALAVTLGVWVTEIPLLVVPVVALIAMVATFLCNALRVGPPGAYMFALACAAGTAMPTGHLTIVQIGPLVFAGGSFSWLAHMVGALVSSRGPERAAVAATAQAVARFLEAVGTPGEDEARHKAALAMYSSWTVLVTQQPAQPRPNGSLSRLRALNRELHLLFVNAMNVPRAGGPSLATLTDKARTIAVQAIDTEEHAQRTDPNHVPLGHHGLWRSLRESLRPWSPPLLVAARVGAATAIAGVIGAALGMERAYWTMAAAVLVLHQGLDWARSLQRGVERTSGTLVGLILAGVILAVHPQGLWLVLTLMLLQFIIEMTVTRNYALAVVFITAAALTIASGGHPVPDVGHTLWARGIDTFIGCMTGIVILAMTTPRTVAMRVPQELVNTLAALTTTLSHAAEGGVTTGAARRARRDLQHRIIALLQAYDASVGATLWHRNIAERSWAAVVAAQRLGYRVLSTCWSLENAGADAAPEMARTLFGPDGQREVRQALATLSDAIQTGTKPAPLSHLPEFLSTEMLDLHDSLCIGREHLQ
jgi:uncharacterized membrane protein YccC